MKKSYRPQWKTSTPKSDRKKNIYMKCGIAKKNGSALVNDSMTKVTCNVYACRSVERTKRGYAEKGTFSVTARFAPFSNVKSTKVQEDEKLLSSRLKLSLESALQLEKFPKSVLEAHVVILDSHLSSTFADIQSASTICLSLAIANAGIDMNDLVVGTRLQLVTKKPSFLCLAIMPNLQKITYISHQGETKPEVLSSGISKCLEQSKHVRKIMRSTLLLAENKQYD